VTEMALFISLVYTRFWHKASRGIYAPLNDVQLLEALDKYPELLLKQPASHLGDIFGIFQRSSLVFHSLMTELKQS